MRRYSVAAVALTCLVAFAAATNPQTSATAQAREDGPCDSQFSSVSLADLADFDSARLFHPLSEARTLFRLHRATEAVPKLDWAIRELAGHWGGRIPADRRAGIARQFKAFRDCIASARPPVLVPVTVTTSEFDETKPGSRGNRIGGAYVYLDEHVRLGGTDPEGTLNAQLPSGRSRLTAVNPPSSAGQADVDLAPGAARAVSIVLDDSKEPAEDTEADLVEAIDDVVRPTSPSFTVRFVEDGMPVPMTSVEDVGLQDPGGVDIALRDADGREIRALTDMFTVAAGAVVAKAPDSLYSLLPRGQWLVLVVTGVDAANLRHWDRIPFRMEDRR